jgi:hypothetical protein
MANPEGHTHQIWDEDYTTEPCRGCGCVVQIVSDGCRFRRNGEAHDCQTVRQDGGTIMRLFEDRVR